MYPLGKWSLAPSDYHLVRWPLALQVGVERSGGHFGRGCLGELADE